MNRFALAARILADAEKLKPEPYEPPGDLKIFLPKLYVAWRKEESVKLADPKKLLKLLVRSKVIYRGKASPDVLVMLREREHALMKARVDGADVILEFRNGDIVAGSEAKEPITPERAKVLLERILEQGLQIVVVAPRE